MADLNIPPKYKKFFPPPPHIWYEPEKIPKKIYNKYGLEWNEETIKILNEHNIIGINSHGSIESSEVIVLPKGITIKAHSIIGTSTFIYFTPYLGDLIENEDIDEETRIKLKVGLKKIKEKNQHSEIYNHFYENVYGETKKDFQIYRPYSIIPNIIFKFHKNEKTEFEQKKVINVLTPKKWDYYKIIIDNLPYDDRGFYKMSLLNFVNMLIFNNIKKATIHIYSCMPFDRDMKEGIPNWVMGDCLKTLPYVVDTGNNKRRRSSLITITRYSGDSKVLLQNDEDDYLGDNKRHSISDVNKMEEQMGSIKFNIFVKNFLRLFPKINIDTKLNNYLEEMLEENEALNEDYEHSIDNVEDNYDNYTIASLPIIMSSKFFNHVDEKKLKNYHILVFYSLFRKRLEEYTMDEAFLLSPKYYPIFFLSKEQKVFSTINLNSFGSNVDEKIEIAEKKYNEHNNNITIEGYVPCIITIMWMNMKCMECNNKVFELGTIIEKIEEPQIKLFFETLINIREKYTKFNYDYSYNIVKNKLKLK